jgi:DNA-binding transcriptional LysR family regulator
MIAGLGAPTMNIHAFETEQLSLKQTPLETAKLFSGAYWEEMRVFLAVAKCSSFGKAAEMLNKSAPTVSRKVKRLQDVMGAQLVVSTMNGAILTDKGIQLAEALAQLDLLLSTLSNELQSEKNEAVGIVRVAATEGLAGFFIAPNLDQIADAFPNIQVSIQTPTNIDRLGDVDKLDSQIN